MIVVYCEDTYGVSFFSKLFIRFKKQQLVSNVKIKVKHLEAMCNTKITRYLKSEQIGNTKGVLIIIDDDHSRGLNITNEKKHIPNNYPILHRVLGFEDEIEELILLSEQISYSGKASNYLKKHHKYRKRDLPKYVDKLNIALIQNHPVIRDAIEFINSCII